MTPNTTRMKHAVQTHTTHCEITKIKNKNTHKPDWTSQRATNQQHESMILTFIPMTERKGTKQQIYRTMKVKIINKSEHWATVENIWHFSKASIGKMVSFLPLVKGD